MSLIYTATANSSGGRRNSLYIGGKADAKDREKLQRWGVTHILNVTPTKEASIQSGIPNYFESSGAFTYKRIPVYDASTSDLLGYADTIVDFISRGLCHGSVLVHCSQGVSRSTTSALFYLMRKANMSFDKAMELVKRRRPVVCPIPAFIIMLKTYDQQCQKERGETSSEQTTSTKSVKRPQAPLCGPSAAVGPSVPPEKRAKIGPSIGPCLPPSMSKDTINAQDPAKKSHIDSGSTHGTIGPSMPPTMDETANNNNNNNEISLGIGPSLPPSITVNPEASATIGPTFPPTTSEVAIGPALPQTTGEATGNTATAAKES